MHIICDFCKKPHLNRDCKLSNRSKFESIRKQEKCFDCFYPKGKHNKYCGFHCKYCENIEGQPAHSSWVFIHPKNPINAETQKLNTSKPKSYGSISFYREEKSPPPTDYQARIILEYDGKMERTEEILQNESDNI